MSVADGKPERLWSLDALRGFDMLFISGLGGIVYELAILIFGGSDAWLAQQMKHVAWEGFHQHDTIFPLFIFLAGVSYPFSCAAARAKGFGTRELVLKATRRLVALVALGLIYNGILQFDFAHQRWASVLARIGMAWYGAALLYLFVRNVKARVAIAVGLLVGYWVVCFFLVAPDAPAGADSFSAAGCFAGYVDRLLLPGRMAEPNLDPEGWLSVFPSVALAMGGVFAGELVRRTDVTGGRKALALVGAAVALAALTWIWTPWCPIIKKIWTPTFVLVCGGADLAVLAALYWIMDVKGWRAWAFPLRVIGLNAITVYLLQKVVDIGSVVRFFVGTSATVQQHFIGSKDLTGFGLCGLCTSQALSLAIYWFVYVLVCWLVLYFLHQKKVFLKV